VLQAPRPRPSDSRAISRRITDALATGGLSERSEFELGHPREEAGLYGRVLLPRLAGEAACLAAASGRSSPARMELRRRPKHGRMIEHAGAPRTKQGQR
jgi:hypothetical protein